MCLGYLFYAHNTFFILTTSHKTIVRTVCPVNTRKCAGLHPELVRTHLEAEEDSVRAFAAREKDYGFGSQHQ